MVDWARTLRGRIKIGSLHKTMFDLGRVTTQRVMSPFTTWVFLCIILMFLFRVKKYLTDYLINKILSRKNLYKLAFLTQKRLALPFLFHKPLRMSGYETVKASLVEISAAGLL